MILTEENQCIVRKACPTATVSITIPKQSGLQAFRTRHCKIRVFLVRSTFFSHLALVGLIVLMYILQSTSVTSITNTGRNVALQYSVIITSTDAKQLRQMLHRQ
jgi:hypothetical protein